ncbi:MAG: hypothetical protein R3F07_04155 [Opitutaceae bacterium]
MKTNYPKLMIAMLLSIPSTLIGESGANEELMPVPIGHSDGASVAEPNTEGLRGTGNSQEVTRQSDQALEVNRRSTMIVNTGISRSDPSVVLGLAEELSLSDDQVLVLKALAAVARQKARSVLSDEQRTQLDVLPSAPESMREMHERLMAELPEMGVGQAGPGGMDSCPVFQMMMEELEAVLGEMAEHRH